MLKCMVIGVDYKGGAHQVVVPLLTCADEHGSTLGTNTPFLAAFQYSLTIWLTQVWLIPISLELSAIEQVTILHLGLYTDIWSCLQLFYGSISTLSIWGFLKTVMANHQLVWYTSHLWHTQSASVSRIGGSRTLCWLRTDLSFYFLLFLCLLLISPFLIFEAPKFLIVLPTYHVILISRSMCTHLGNLSTYSDFRAIAFYPILFALSLPYLLYLWQYLACTFDYSIPLPISLSCTCSDLLWKGTYGLCNGSALAPPLFWFYLCIWVHESLSLCFPILIHILLLCLCCCIWLQPSIRALIILLSPSHLVCHPLPVSNVASHPFPLLCVPIKSQSNTAWLKVSIWSCLFGPHYIWIAFIPCWLCLCYFDCSCTPNTFSTLPCWLLHSWQFLAY